MKSLNTSNESGSALVYILIAIALLAALTFTFMEPSSQQTSSQNTFKTVSGLKSQADMIRSAIQECALSYPRGDRCIRNTSASYAYCTTDGEEDSTAYDNYPIDPASDFYANATPSQAAKSLARNMRCPGNNGGDNIDHDNHALIFGGRSGKFLPPAPDLFEEWQIYNGEDGVFFWTSTDKTDAFIVTALTKLDDEFSSCEADVVDASSSDQDLDSNGVTTCASGSICFRIRMITNTATAVWNGDAESDEDTDGCY